MITESVSNVALPVIPQLRNSVLCCQMTLPFVGFNAWKSPSDQPINSMSGQLPHSPIPALTDNIGDMSCFVEFGLVTFHCSLPEKSRENIVGMPLSIVEDDVLT